MNDQQKEQCYYCGGIADYVFHISNKEKKWICDGCLEGKEYQICPECKKYIAIAYVGDCGKCPACGRFFHEPEFDEFLA